MSIYKITLKNCAFFARHGVFNEEETLGQRFFVDAVLDVDGGNSLTEDEIEGTVDYGQAFGVIERIITGKRRFLIEALALETAKAICSEFAMVRRAEITIRKPNAPVQGVLDYVEVTIVHEPDIAG
ncbi:MAG: dihydroneopterin aldolase [Rhizobiaceae bacterium]|nr:dihydroneopterin aldolase [Rhizobiaceae bacterium]